MIGEKIARFFRAFSVIQVKFILAFIYLFFILPWGVIIRLIKRLSPKQTKTFWIFLPEKKSNLLEDVYRQY